MSKTKPTLASSLVAVLELYEEIKQQQVDTMLIIYSPKIDAQEKIKRLKEITRPLYRSNFEPNKNSKYES